MQKKRSRKPATRGAGPAFSRLVRLMARLRKECPWDREQTHESLRPYMIEEAYEAVEAITAGGGEKLPEELGDVLLQVVFHAGIAGEKGIFSIVDVIRTLEEKLIRRHPHVFGKGRNRGGPKAAGAADVKRTWEQNKTREAGAPVLSGVPASMPALLRAQRLQEKAASVGFDWKEAEQVREKISEELDELRLATASGDREHIREELGDLLFAVVNYARFLGVNAETALSDAAEKFTKRFAYIERRLAAGGDGIRSASLGEMERYWQESKGAQKK